MQVGHLTNLEAVAGVEQSASVISCMDGSQKRLSTMWDGATSGSRMMAMRCLRTKQRLQSSNIREVLQSRPVLKSSERYGMEGSKE